MVESATAGVTSEQVQAMQRLFPLPDLQSIDDTIANGTYVMKPGEPRPLALFSAERVDFSLVQPHPLHGHRARAFPALRAVHQLSALCRRVHRFWP